MRGLSLGVEIDPGVVKGAIVHAVLEVPDDACRRPQRGQAVEHGLKPALREHEVVVDQGKNLAIRHAGARVIRAGVAAVFLLKNMPDGRGEGPDPFAGPVRARVVNQDDLVIEA